MKKDIILILAIIFLLNISNSNAQENCYEMILDNDYHIEYTSYGIGYHQGNINPDSIMVDTCFSSQTYGKKFAKKYFFIVFNKDMYPFDNQLDENEIKRISDISELKTSIKRKFQEFEIQFGTFFLQGERRDIPDSIFFDNPTIRVLFDNYQNIEEIISSFSSFKELFQIVYYDDRSNCPLSIPNDLALTPNKKYSDIYMAWKKNRNYWNGTWEESSYYGANFLPFGMQSAIYEMNCPLAWEISMGSSNIIIGLNESWSSFPSKHVDIVENLHTTNNIGDLKSSTELLTVGHGLNTMSNAVGRANNGFPLVGTAPYCKGACINGEDGALDYDMDGLSNRYNLLLDIENRSFGGSNSNYRAKRNIIDSGVVLVVAAGNDRVYGNSGGGAVNAVLMPDGTYELRPGKFYPGASAFEDFFNPGDPLLDFRVIAVAASKSGDLNNKFCESWGHNYIGGNTNAKVGANFSKDIQFHSTWNFSPGIDKFNISDKVSERIAAKEDAYVDLVAPGEAVLVAMETNPLRNRCDELHSVGSMDWFNCKMNLPSGTITSIEDIDYIMTRPSSQDNDFYLPGLTITIGMLKRSINESIQDARKYGIMSGTSHSTPYVSGIVGLMLSVNKFMGAELKVDNKPYRGADVQRAVYNAITFTAKKIDDFENFSTERFVRNGRTYYYSNSFPSGQPYQYEYKLQWNDKLKRTWAQRVGFGHVNAYRAVAHSIRQKGEYFYEFNDQELEMFERDANGDSRGYVNPDGKRLMHWGSKVREGNEMFEMPEWRGPSTGNDDILNVLDWGGISLPGEYHNNQGVTKVRSRSGNRSYMRVMDDQILAIDGILFSDHPEECNYVIAESSKPKILMEGYLKDVEIFGNLRIGDLIVESTINNGIAGIPGCVGFGGNCESEMYGHIQTKNFGLIYLWGNAHAKPGTIISLNGSENLTLYGNSELHLEHASRIETNNGRKVVVNSGTKLVVNTRSVVELDLEVNVKNGGTFIIEEESIVRLKKLNVEKGGLIQITPGATLSLEAQEHICDGHFKAIGLPTKKVSITGNLTEHCLPYDDALYSDFPHISTQPTIYMKGECGDPNKSGLTLSNVVTKDIAIDLYNMRVMQSIDNCEFLSNTKLTNPYFSFDYLVSLRYNNCEDCLSPLVKNVSFDSCKFKDLSRPIPSINDPNNLNELEFRTGGLVIDGYEKARVNKTYFSNLEYGVNTYNCVTTLISSSKFDSCGIGNYDFGSRNYMCSDTFNVVQYGTIRNHSLVSKTVNCLYNLTRVAYRAESSHPQKFRSNIFNDYLQGISGSNTELILNDQIEPNGIAIYGANFFYITQLPTNLSTYKNKFITKQCEIDMCTDINLENNTAVLKVYCGGNRFSEYATYHVRKDIKMDMFIPLIDFTNNYMPLATPQTYYPRVINVNPYWNGSPSDHSIRRSRSFSQYECCGDLYYQGINIICDDLVNPTCSSFEDEIRILCPKVQDVSIKSLGDYITQKYSTTKISSNEILSDLRVLNNSSNKDEDYESYFKYLSNNTEVINLAKIMHDYENDVQIDFDKYKSAQSGYFQFMSKKSNIKLTDNQIMSSNTLLSYVRNNGRDNCLETINSVDDAKDNALNIISISPNPVVSDLNIRYYLPNSSIAKLKVTDINGKVLINITNLENNSGINEFKLSCKDLSSGMYLLQLSTENEIAYKSFIIKK